jgi:ATP-dependent Lon protease
MSQPKVLSLLPLRDVVIYPYMVVPLFVGRDRSKAALEHTIEEKGLVFLVTQKNPQVNNPTEKDLHAIGTVGSVIQMIRMPDGTAKVLIEGLKRATIEEFVSKEPYFQVKVKEIEEEKISGAEVEALIRSIREAFEAYLKLNKNIPPEVLLTVSNIDDPIQFGFVVIAQINIKLQDRQQLLEINETKKRLEKILELIQGEIEILEVERRIRNRVKRQMEKTQREYYLNEQMQAIQKELGERDGFKAEITDLEKKITEKNLSLEARNKAKAELRKMKMMSPMSAEATVIRNYLEWLVGLPWPGDEDDSSIELDFAEQILAKEHYGLEKIKERILEHLAIMSLSKHVRSPILCLVGPPGVGKTSLGRSIATAMKRKFVRNSLGGIRDEAEIRGHRRTYIGALPGRIIQSMKKAGTINPVMMLDEIDKMAMDFRGDPASALLEVLDPEQNKQFSDHYLEVEYDLSKVVFIATANTIGNIPRPLLDRMEVIELNSYTEIEKLHIAKQHLIPKQLELHGMRDDQIAFSDAALKEMILHYTKEAGVRNLERMVASALRKSVTELIRSKGKTQKIQLKPSHVQRFFGPRKFRFTEAQTEHRIGIVSGLAWTELGGDLLTIEAIALQGTGKLTITGQLGEVMQESAQAALSYVRARAKEFTIDPEFYKTVDIHIHVPEGAIPKDGPSAGITMATAIASAILKCPVNAEVAMTGEITLRGQVLPIGGLREKMLAAVRGGIKKIIIPKDNESALDEIPKEIKSRLQIILVGHFDEVLKEVLVLPPEKKTVLEQLATASATKPSSLSKPAVLN